MKNKLKKCSFWLKMIVAIKIMRAVIQRVKEARVKIENEIVGKIGKGLLVLLGVKGGDSAKDIKYLAEKILNLRIFPDEQGKMNRSLLEIKGQVLIVPQFTLYGDCKKGKRPSFVQAASSEVAEKLYQEFVKEIKKSGLKTETGKFGALMQVELVNEGPVTLILES